MMPLKLKRQECQLFSLIWPRPGCYRSVGSRSIMFSPHLKDIFTPIWSGPFLEAIGDGTTETNSEDPRKLKKGELVSAAERRQKGSNGGHAPK